MSEQPVKYFLARTPAGEGFLGAMMVGMDGATLDMAKPFLKERLEEVFGKEVEPKLVQFHETESMDDVKAYFKGALV